MASEKFPFTWSIHNFSAISKMAVRNKGIYASHPLNNQISFNYIFFPKGDIPTTEGYAALIVYLIDFHVDNMIVSFNASLLNQSGEKRFIKERKTIFRFKQGLNDGWPDFVLLADILNPANRMLDDDTLTIHLELEIASHFLSGPNRTISSQEVNFMGKLANLFPSKSPSELEKWFLKCKFAHIWTIHNFSALLTEANSEVEFIDSENFYFPHDKTTQFYLRLYPKGCEKTDKNALEFQLCYSEESDVAKCSTLNLHLSIIDNNFMRFNHQCKEVKLESHKEKKSLIWPLTVIPHEFLRSNAQTILGNNKLIVLCEIDAVTHPIIKDLPEDLSFKYMFQLACMKLSSENDFTETQIDALNSSTKYEYTWTIENADTIDSDVSKTFDFRPTVGNLSNFTVSLWPFGVRKNREFVGILFDSFGKMNKTYRIKISIFDVWGNKEKYKEIQRSSSNLIHEHDPSYKFGFEEFIRRDDLFDRNKGLLSETNELKILIEIIFVNPSTHANSNIARKYLNSNLQGLYKTSTYTTRLCHKWTLNNFKAYFDAKKVPFQMENLRFTSEDDFIKKLPFKSDSFTCEIVDKFQFNLKFLLLDRKNLMIGFGAQTDKLSIEKSLIRFDLLMIDENGQTFKIRENNVFKIEKLENNFLLPFEQKDFPKNKFFPSDKISIICEIYIFATSPHELIQQNKFVISKFDCPWTIQKQCETMSFSESQTDLKMLNYSFNWSIDDFTDYGEDLDKPEFIESNTFYPHGNERLQFSLQVYPNGESGETRDTSTICFFVASFEKNNLTARVKISILNKNGELFNTKSKILELKKGSNRDWFIYVQKNYLIENDLLLGNKLTIHCETEMLFEPENLPVEYSQVFIQNTMSSLLNHKQPTDFVFTFADNSDEQLHVHKCVLSAQSRVFSAMFQSEMQEQITNQVEIVEVPVQVFKVLLTYLYTGLIEFKQLDMVVELFIASNKYGFDKLKSDCEEWLCVNLTKDTVAEMLALADLHQTDQLKAYALNYIRKYIAKIVKTDDFQKLVQNFPNLVNELVIDFANLNLADQEDDDEDEDEDISVL